MDYRSATRGIEQLKTSAVHLAESQVTQFHVLGGSPIPSHTHFGRKLEKTVSFDTRTLKLGM